jgi:hypothetical protein
MIVQAANAFYELWQIVRRPDLQSPCKDGLLMLNSGTNILHSVESERPHLFRKRNDPHRERIDKQPRFRRMTQSRANHHVPRHQHISTARVLPCGRSPTVTAGRSGFRAEE